MNSPDQHDADEATLGEDVEFSVGDYMQLVEILSWRLVTELWRRFPLQFNLIEMHPCGGQYDCLALLIKGTTMSAIDVNRGGGSVHIHKHAFGLAGDMAMCSDWVQRMLGPAPRRILDAIADEARLRVPKQLPVSTPAALTFRFIADFLTHSFGRLGRWECRNGFEDTSGCGGGVRHHFFEQFPALADVAARQYGTPIMGEHAYCFWFLVKDGKPMLCLDTSGRVFRRDGTSHDLLELYQHDRRIWPLICVAALDILP